jgi:hypothetical protein
MTNEERKVFELALEALEKSDKIRGFPNNKKTITAIKELLAQPEHEPVAFKCGDATVYIKPPVYGTSPPQRPWVGLTDDEIDQGLLRSNHALQTAGAWRDGVEWATKQLKEKNT